MFSKDNLGINVDKLKICIGKDSKATTEANNVILFGYCAIKNNRDDTRAIQVLGCPPDIGKYYPLLVKLALPTVRAIGLLLTRKIKNTAFKMGVYTKFTDCGPHINHLSLIKVTMNKKNRVLGDTPAFV